MITVYADGSAIGNPGPGGWAAILVSEDGASRTLTGGAAHTTNNRMELMAATEALQVLPADVPSVVFCDSEYVVKGATIWRRDWKRRGWKSSSGKLVANLDLWQALYAVLDTRPLATFRWVRGHAGNRLNETADKLARAEAEKRKLARDTRTDPAPFGRQWEEGR
ncbi:ribonuclease HI [Xanthobacter flavus]|uniref:Ribonuclease H n=1 Tax=Xanthobacter flavus TaxID=281 RepID=A0A9W6FLD2_XANFL|nr:ribonuclease HI [Xanthobacter flavus]MDR6332037.1 ribonuclease HI [Xanthobacter flavus]GLI22217.1 ribonuclease H [Xanthobacter flavus]